MTEKAKKSVRVGFEQHCVELPLSVVQTSKPLLPNIKLSRKYAQIRASIDAVGLVEPLVVIAHAAQQGTFVLLDGHLRYEALKELGKEQALCLLARDDEAFTYNKRVSRLSVIQEHRMIVRATQRGVSVETLCSALGIKPISIRERFRLLDGVCPEVIELLADKPAPRSTIIALRQMKPLRQIEVTESMIAFGNYTHNLATAMLHATPAEQLVDRGKAKAQSGSSTETLRRLQRELAAVQADTKQIEDSYGPANLKLVIVKTHIKSLLENARVVRWLAKFRRDYLQQLQLIAEITELPAE